MGQSLSSSASSATPTKHVQVSADKGAPTEKTMSEQKRINRALTQKYDMHQLKALQKLEEEFMEVVCPIFKCDEDTLPVVVDLLKIFNEPADHRKTHLEELLKDAPSDCSALIARVVSEMARIDIEHQQHEHAHDEKAHK